VKRNHLGTEEILTWSDTLWDMDNMIPFVVYDGIGPPFTTAVAFFLDLEPVGWISMCLSYHG
jgi:hypothetical protein